jgi:CDP-4-dehydro-6-deoxyglucose reductase, E1
MKVDALPEPFGDRHEMRRVVRGWLDAARAAAAARESRYWYPLSLPTFDEVEITEAIESMCRCETTMGAKTAAFERAYADWVGAAHAVMVNSGSSADLLAAYVLADPGGPRLEPGDEVLLPAVTWPTQIWSILMAGFSGRLVDADPATLNMDLDDLERKITPRTRAIFVVHLMGNPLDMDGIGAIADRHGLMVLEDCCEALGARWQGRSVGTFGLAGTCSFFFSHHMTTMEGGMVTCEDDRLAATFRQLRAHGWVRGGSAPRPSAEAAGCDPRFLFTTWGFNLRPTEVQASFGLHQLARQELFRARRNALAERFFAFVDDSRWLSRPRAEAAAEPAWFALPVLLAESAPFGRDQLAAELEAAGVETRPIVTGNIARQPAARLFPQLACGALPGADRIHDRGLYLGLSPTSDARQIDRLIETCGGILARLSGGRRGVRAA